MSTVSINSKNTTARHVRENLSDVSNSLHKLATGKKYNNPGQGVVEQSVARSIDVQRSTADITLDVVKDASNMLDSTYYTVSSIREDVLKQYQIAVTASSNTFSNLEDLQKQFSSLKDQINYSANFSYNGISLLNGSFSGEAMIDTKLGTKEHYNITSVDQYVSTGTIGDGSFLEKDSVVEFTDKLGKVQASGSLALGAPIVDGDTVTINGTLFTAKAVVTDSTKEFVVDANNTATIKNLIQTLNESKDPDVAKASYRYANNLGTNANVEGITIYNNELGTEGNNFTYSATGANTVATQNLSGGEDYKTAATAASFPQDLKGKFEDISMRFRHDNAGNYNVVQFEARINGETYTTQEMILGIDGFGGYLQGGNKLANNTTLYFQKIGARETDIGFGISVGNADLIITNTSDVDLIQEECKRISDLATEALRDVSLSINASSTTEEDFGLDTASKFVISGEVGKDAYLDEAVNITDKIGLQQATGVIKIAENPIIGNRVVVNGETIYFGTDVAIGLNATATRDNLARYLNASTNENVSKAIYTSSTTEDSIIVTSKIFGTEGQNFTIAVDNNNITLNNLSPFIKSANLGDNSVEALGTRSEFTKARGSIKFTNNPANNTVLVFGTPTAANVPGNASIVTFKTTINPSTTGPNQVPIGTAVTDTVINLVSVLNNSTDSNISKAKYEIDPTDRTKVLVTYKDYGVAGNTFPLFHATTANTLTTSVAAAATTIVQLSGGDVVDVPVSGLAATGMITLTAANGALPTGGDNVNINGTIFTFRATPATTVLPTDVFIGANINDATYNLLNALNNSTNSNVQQASYSVVNIGTSTKHVPGVKITYKTPGVIGNTFTLATSVAAGTANVPAKITINNASPNSAAATAPATLTGGFDPFNNNEVRSGLDVISDVESHSPFFKGVMTNLSGVFVEGTAPDANAVRFSTTVGTLTYVGEALLSGGNATGTNASGSNYNGLGHLITKGTKIILNSPDRSYGIVFTTNEDIDLTGSSKAGADNALADVVSKMRDAISSVIIMQERTLASFDESKVVSTPLDGLKKEDIKIIDSNFDVHGLGGNIGKFSIDNVNNIISVRINNIVYSQKLSDSVFLGGLGGSYDATNKIINGGSDVTLILKPHEQDDSRALKISLKNVKDIQISNATQVESLEDALNNSFGSGKSNGLQFKIGTGPEAMFSIKFRDMSSDNIYRGSDGLSIANLNVTTKDDAKIAVDVLENTLKDFNSDLSSIGSSRNRFDSILGNLTALIDSLDSSQSNLLDVDVAEVSGEMIRNMLKVNSAALAQMHEMNVLRDLVSTLTSGR